jgi:hypothetical protein
MRRALTRAASVALLVAALGATRVVYAEGSRPVVRVVLVAGGESPAWFDGFVKHLQSELVLRGIEVAVSRGAMAARGGSGLAPRADAELVVEAPSPLRPLLRFSVAATDGSPSAESTSNRIRQVNLAGVPSDGCALAMAVSADELMRSNWPRAIPAASAVATAEGKGSPPAPAKESGASKPPEEVARPAEAAARSDDSASKDSKPKARGESASGIEAGVAATPSAEADQGLTADRGAVDEPASHAPGTSRFLIGASGAGEAFTGGQMQLGADLRLGMRVFPRWELGVRGGFRRVAPHEAPSGVIDGSAVVAGGALGFLVVGGGRATLWLMGRADVLRAVYTGQPRDANNVGYTRSAMGMVVSAGPVGRIAVTRTLGLEGEILAGASPFTATVTDSSNPAVSTNGAAIVASVGLFWAP